MFCALLHCVVLLLVLNIPGDASNNVTHCINGQRDTSLVVPGMITFNFYKDGKVKVFQVPKCLFATEVADSVFANENFFEDLDSYKKRVQKYFIPLIHATFKSFASNTPVKTQPDFNLHQKIDIQGVEFFVKDDKYFGNVTRMRTTRFYNRTCQYFTHATDIVFSFSQPCLDRVFSMDHGYLYYMVNEDFFMFQVQHKFDTMILIFGNTKNIYFKAPFRKVDFMYRQTTRDDMLIIGYRDDIKNSFNYMTENFVDDILSQNYEDISVSLKLFNDLALDYLVSGNCGVFEKRYMQLFFLYGLITFTYGRHSNAGFMTMDKILDDHMSLLVVNKFMEKCFNVELDVFGYPELKKLHNLKPSQYSYIDARDSYLALKLIFLSISYGNILDIDRDTLRTVGRIGDRLYNKYKFGHNITDEDRLMLQFLSEISECEFLDRSLDRSTQKTMLLQMTNLCHPKELILWSRRLKETISLFNIFTPCMGMGRRDLDRSFVQLILKYGNSERNLDSALNVLKAYRKKKLTSFPHINCLSPETKVVILPLMNYTYTVSDKYILQGNTYGVTTTVLTTNVIITAIPTKTPCQRTNYKYGGGKIKVLANVTSSTCDLCHSIIVEYDDVDGFVSSLYVKDNAELKHVTNPDTGILSSNPRIHYLLLVNNGSVFEITTLDVNITEFSIVMFIVYLIAAGLLIFGLYKLFKLI